MKGVCWKIGRYTIGASLLAILAIGCKKGSGKENDDNTIEIMPKVSPVGQAMEAGVTKQIGPAGGMLTSADQTISITIPAGALATATTIGIQAINNTNVGGKGNAFRLTPHGQQFAKPVKIDFSYSAFRDSMLFPSTAVISYQGDDGVWQMPAGSVVDTVARKVTYETTHFSDWALMERVSLKPVAATLAEGQKLTVQALIYNALPNPCNCLNDLLQPLPPRGNPYPVGDPSPLPARYIKSWRLVGPGSINRTSGNSVEYKAPDAIAGFASATVVAQLKGDDQGKYLLLSNIQLATENWIEMSIGGGAAVLYEATPVFRNGDKYLFSGGKDDAGQYIGMQWIGGVGTHAFDLNGNTTWHFNTPGNNYTSSYIPAPRADLAPSGGGITVTSIEGGWIAGSFVVSPAGYDNFLKQSSARGKFRARLITQ